MIRKPRVNGESSSVVAATELSRSRLAYSGEILPPAPLSEASCALPYEATQKSVMIEPMAPIQSLIEELEPAADQAAAARRERADMDSFPPLVSSEYEEANDEYPPEVISRRKRARKLVGVFIAAAALFFAFGLGKTALASRGASVSSVVSDSKAEVARVEAIMGESINGLVRSMGDIVKQAPATMPVVAVPATATAAPAVAQADPEQGAKLRKEAESLLNRGRYKDSIEVSRAAIAADPSNATSYLLLGTALQTTGKWKQGIEAYSECVRNATRGPVNECAAVGGHK